MNSDLLVNVLADVIENKHLIVADIKARKKPINGDYLVILSHLGFTIEQREIKTERIVGKLNITKYFRAPVKNLLVMALASFKAGRWLKPDIFFMRKSLIYRQQKN